MGTRGLYGFRKNGCDKAVYHHYDSYPEGLGKEFVDFIKVIGVNRLNDFFEKIEEIDIKKPPTAQQIQYAKQNGWYTDSVSERSEKDWYCLLHGLQNLCNWEKSIESDTPIMIENDIDFITDSLFCEYAYILNFDTNELEFYEGFQNSHDPHSRYTGYHDGYCECRLVLTIPTEELLKTPSYQSVSRMTNA